MAFVRNLGSNDNGRLLSGDFFIIGNGNGKSGFWVYSPTGFFIVQSTNPLFSGGGGDGGGGPGPGAGAAGGGGNMIPIYGTRTTCAEGAGGTCITEQYIMYWIIMNYA